MKKPITGYWIKFIICVSLVLCLGFTVQAKEREDTIHVYILAGQSNMQGQAVIDLDHPKYYNSGRGTLNFLMNPKTSSPALIKRLSHLKDKQGKWVVRNDVMISYQRERGQSKIGPLSIGYAVYDGKHHFGPELQFGHLIGNATKNPVLLIKTAWGGKSLYKDFRPPSAVKRGGGEVGVYYTKMLKEVDETLKYSGKLFPKLKDKPYQIKGFVWFQGWNDMFNDQGKKEYKLNMIDLINDVRKEWKRPLLPVVIGETGNGGNMDVRNAQKEAALHPPFKGNVKFVPTRSFLRKKEDSPNTGHGHHWFGNAESYFLIGDALGKAMIDLLKE